MIIVRQHQHIRCLIDLEPKSEQQIAKELGISRCAVDKELQSDEVPRYPLIKERTAPWLDPCKARLLRVVTGKSMVTAKATMHRP